MKRYLIIIFSLTLFLSVRAQNIVFSQAHGFCEKSFVLTMSLDSAELKPNQTIRYTIDGSVPTSKSTVYNSGIKISHNTIIRAAVIDADTLATGVATATYLFAEDVLNQGNSPKGYPDMWGPYCEQMGNAIADYEMDPEMTKDASLRDKIIEGLTAIPTLSIVTDKDNFFSHDEDEETGGIYIYTGAPVGVGTGRDWERPVSMELFGGAQQHDLTVDCGVKIHGGHSRLPEKTPKHSLRLMFKSKYGPSKLKYKVFGKGGAKKFDQLTLRCAFGNTWEHWDSGNRKRAQYSRDMWARSTQRLMGHPSSRGLYVHVYINGMYWGLYNIAERVDDYYCSSNFDGEKEDYDVIKVEEYKSTQVEAGDGTMDKWREMVSTAIKASDSPAAYAKLLGVDADGNRSEEYEPLLDVDNFVDYMLINQYAGNTDWDHHNWLAFRNRTAGNEGFKFICWDSELIFGSEDENVLEKKNSGMPSGIFNYLMENKAFRHTYYNHVHKHLEMEGGLLTPEKVAEVWDSLYNIIRLPLYDEAARWGDYRRDVHQYTSKGELYTVDGRFMKERTRLCGTYFPSRTNTLLQQLKDKGWYTSVAMPSIRINGKEDAVTDTISYGDLVTLKIVASTYITFDGSEPYTWFASQTGKAALSAFKYTPGTNVFANYDWSQGNVVTVKAVTKGSPDWSCTMERTFYVKDVPTDINNMIATQSVPQQGIYDLSGRRISSDMELTGGVYIVNGKKVVRF